MSQQPWGAPPPPRRPGGQPYAGWPQSYPGGAPGRAPQPGAWPPPNAWQQPRPYPPAPRRAAPGPGDQWQRQQRPPRRGPGFLGIILRMVMTIVVLSFLMSLARDLLAPGAPGQAQQRTDPPITRTDPNTPYENEAYTPPPVDLDPPPVPGPRNASAAETLVTQNPVYEQNIPSPTNCQMDRVAVPSLSAREKEAHFNELMGCLMRVYDRPVEAAGFTMPRPPVTVYTRPIKTACGDFREVNAAYCTGDQQIYYANNLLDAFPTEVARADYAAETVLAHEFGHAIQARTAILISGKYLEQGARSEAAAQDLSRRTEVQADCFSGQYVRSVAASQGLGPSEQAALQRLAYNLGDDVLSGRPGYAGGHGTGQARQEWFTRGLNADSIEACNAFVAPADEVR